MHWGAGKGPAAGDNTSSFCHAAIWKSLEALFHLNIVDGGVPRNMHTSYVAAFNTMM